MKQILRYSVFVLVSLHTFASISYSQSGFPLQETLFDVKFTDANTGNVVGSKGTILRTTDGGASWINQESGTVNELMGVSFTDTDTGTVVGFISSNGLGIILRTTDGGTTWTSQPTGINVVPSALLEVSFTDGNTGTIVGSRGIILRSTDGGATWTRQTSGTMNDLLGVSFTDSNTGTVVGQNGTILRTINGGVTWTSQSSGTSSSLLGVSFTDTDTGTVVGWNGIILRTTDGGATWSNQSSGTSQVLRKVFFTDTNTGTVIGLDGGILRTTNGGVTWTSQSSGTSYPLYGVAFTDANSGIVVGRSGTILRTTNGGETWTSLYFNPPPQTLMDYVLEVKGDTLVIKDYYDMNNYDIYNQPNSLYKTLLLDSVDVPAGRVYELHTGGFYPLLNRPTSRPGRTTVIVGSDPTMVVNNKNAALSPPLICTDNSALGWALGVNAGGDLTIKNCQLVNTANDGRTGIYFTTTNASNLNLVFDNCIFEHTTHRFVHIRYDSNQNVTFRNSYFINMSGHPCRRCGGVFISFNNQDTLLVENCTHIMAQSQVYKFMISEDTYQFKRIIFNHNTFVNCAGSVFMNPGYQSNVSLTNNIFVNCNVQSYPGIGYFDLYEQDPDGLPMGLVNVYPDSANVANNTPRKFLCQDNLVYWDPSLADMDSILNANAVNGVTNWQSQMIIMNSRTDSMFKHLEPYNTTPYSYLNTDTWKNQMPSFTDPKDLFTTQLINLKTFALATVDINSIDVLPDWRLVNTSPDKFVNPDWPIPVDLSYSDTDLQTAGLGGFPLGDLNWFPAKKAEWNAQRDHEYAIIQEALDQGNLISGIQETGGSIPGQYKLHQNYPNPFNPTTVISYKLPISSFVTIKVYDVLGREVQTLVNEPQNAGDHSVTFSAGNLPSGMYLYRLQAGDYSAAKKLLLLK
jgi:photosystem II stability/assembly factor-like uncharacterized protein